MIVHNVYRTTDGKFLGRLKPSNEICAGILKQYFMPPDEDSEPDKPIIMDGKTDRYNGIISGGLQLGTLDVGYMEQHDPWDVQIKVEFGDLGAEEYEYPGYKKWCDGSF